jgi:arylsulfatase I/J
MSSIAQVLKRGGFSTAMVGKQDQGMATETHTPRGRGFDQSLIYLFVVIHAHTGAGIIASTLCTLVENLPPSPPPFHSHCSEHKNDYYDQTLMQSVCQAYNPIVDLWEHNGTYAGPARALNGTGYEEFLFRDRVLQILAGHDFDAAPLFLLYTPHVAHCPLQVPPDWLARFQFADDEAACAAQTPYIFPGSGAGDYRCRAQYHAMVALLDEVLGNVTDAVRARGLRRAVRARGGALGLGALGRVNDHERRDALCFRSRRRRSEAAGPVARYFLARLVAPAVRY